MHRVGKSMEIDKFPIQPLPVALHFSSLFWYMYDAFVSLCFQFHNILNAMISKVFRVLNLYVSRLVNTTSKHD